MAKVRESDGSTSLAAGGCLENPSYIDPCIEVASLGCTIGAVIITYPILGFVVIIMVKFNPKTLF